MSLLLKKIFTEVPKARSPGFFAEITGAQPIILHVPRGTAPALEAFFSKYTASTAALKDVSCFQEIVEQPLPFKNQFIELTNSVGLNIKGQGHIEILGFSIREVSPRMYRVWVCIRLHALGFAKASPLAFYSLTAPFAKEIWESSAASSGTQEIFLLTGSIVLGFLKVLNGRTEYGETPADFVLKKGFGAAASRTEIKKIVHIRPYKSQESKEYQGKEIDWSHRWKVRGHWRKVSSIGKDRNGDYGVPGFTWVLDHVRGPEEKPLVEKTYLMNTKAFDTEPRPTIE